MQGNGDYISREAFKQEVRRLSSHLLNEWDTLGVLAAADRIQAADVRPVVKATWIVKEMQALFPGMDEHPVFACSECGYQIYDVLDNVKERHHFCPNCGARMEES